MPIVFDKLLGKPLMHEHESSGVADGSVTLAKMADMDTASLIYRKTAGAGVPEVNTLATLKTDLGLTGTNTGDNATNTQYSGLAASKQDAITVGTTAPGSPTTGQLWVDSN